MPKNSNKNSLKNKLKKQVISFTRKPAHRGDGYYIFGIPTEYINNQMINIKKHYKIYLEEVDCKSCKFWENPTCGNPRSKNLKKKMDGEEGCKRWEEKF